MHILQCNYDLGPAICAHVVNIECAKPQPGKNSVPVFLVKYRGHLKKVMQIKIIAIE